MICRRWHRLVALYAGDDLDRPSAAKVEHHLAACASCRGLEHELRQDRLRLRDLDAAAIDGLDLGSVRGAVMAEVESRRNRSPVIFQPRLLSALAVAVFVIALALVFRQVQQPGVPRNVSREAPSPTPGLVAAPERRERSLPQPPPAAAFEAPKAADNRVARAEPSPLEPVARTSPSAPVEPMTIKILTDDPEVVIYWIVDPKGDKEHV